MIESWLTRKRKDSIMMVDCKVKKMSMIPCHAMVWFILTCIVVTMKTTRMAILPIFPPRPLPMLKRKRTESEKV